MQGCKKTRAGPPVRRRYASTWSKRFENCPWCGARFQPDSFTLLPDDDKPSELRIVCTNFECDFTRDRALPIVAVAERAYRDAGGHKNPKNPADPYMTVLGYFNSLRELGGARRIIEEEIRNTIKAYGRRKRIGEKRGLFQDRKTFSEVVELTSRVPTDKVAEARRRLETYFHDKQRVDCAIATNMISVGLDIPRLGLMVVTGQPKTHSGYIQATSRVGRDDQRPGLVHRKALDGRGRFDGRQVVPTRMRSASSRRRAVG